MANLGLGRVVAFRRPGAAETRRRLGLLDACMPEAPAGAKPAASFPLRSVMFLLSIAAHVGLVAVLLAVPVEKMHVGTDEKARVVSVELVAASAPPKPEKPVQPVVAPPKPEKETIEKTPVAKRKKRENPAPSPKETAPVVAAPVEAAPVAAVPANGEARMSSAASETRAAGRRAYGHLVWKRIAERKPVGLRLAGTAYVIFSVTADGGIGAISITRSSGNVGLDALALRTIKSAAPFDPPPADLTAEDLVFEIPFNFR